MKPTTLFSALLILGLASLVSAKPDYNINLGTLHGQLRFSPEAFAVKPGSVIRLSFDNSDEMIHNLILVKGDGKTANRIAEAALKLGEKGMEMGFVPKDPSIVASIGLVQPGKKLRLNSPLRKKREIIPTYAPSPGIP